MKIDRLHVKGFGKLENFDITLSGGLNVIYGPNESGKSTLIAFIKAILYGLKGGRTSKNGSMPDAKRYKPWSNTDYSGYINIELENGKTYRIDRNFESGTVKLFDNSFNEITDQYNSTRDKSAIAEKLLGINESIFERTVYIKQLGTRIENSASKDLIDRISNLRESGAEDISYKNANMALKEALKQQVGTDRSYTRPLDIINKRLDDLIVKKSTIEDRNKSKREALERKKELESQITKLSNKLKLFTKLKEFCDTKEKLHIQNEKKNEVVFLNERIKSSFNQINDLQKNKASIEQDIADNSKKIDEINSSLSLQNYSTTGDDSNIIKNKKRYRYALSVCGAISIIATIATCVAYIFDYIDLEYISIPIAFTLIFTTFWFINNKKITKIVQQDIRNSVEVKAIKIEYDNVSKIELILKKQLDSLNSKITFEKEQQSKLNERLESLNTELNVIDIEQKIDSLSEMILTLKESLNNDLTKAELNICNNVFEGVYYKDSVSISELIQYSTEQLNQKNIEKMTIEARFIKDDEQEADIIDEEIYKLTQQKERLEQRGEALNIAIKTLEEASAEVQKKYTPVMNKVFNEKFSELTAQKYSDVRAGEDLNIMLSDPQSQTIIPGNVLSGGTIDQLYLALRIAISETVLNISESLPFIMDEPFSQYDDERVDNALNCINEISKKQQVIIFTCKQREVELINNKFDCRILSLV